MAEQISTAEPSISQTLLVYSFHHGRFSATEGLDTTCFDSTFLYQEDNATHNLRNLLGGHMTDVIPP